MSDTQTVTINTGDEGAKGPSLEDQYKTLVEEGLIDPEGETPGEEAKSEGSNDERPEWLPEKFKSPADLAKAYAELEKKLAGGKPAKADEVAPAPKATPEQREAAEAATKKAGLDLNTVSAEYAEAGGLSDETYTKLADAGYPKEMVDIYIEGLTARSTAVVTQAYQAAGGEEAYGSMIDWAIENLDEAEQSAFDAAVNSNNAGYALMAIKGLKARMDAAVRENQSEEPSEQISKGGKVSGQSYETIDDYMEDVNDPRYDTNESFRRTVAAKLARSNIM